MDKMKAFALINNALRKAYAAGAFADDGLEGAAAVLTALRVVQDALTTKEPCAPCEEKKAEAAQALPNA